MTLSAQQTWHDAERLLQARQHAAARAGYESIAGDPDWTLPANLRLSAIALQDGRLRDAVAHALAAYAVREPDPVLLEALCRQLIAVGELEAAVDCAQSPVVSQAHDPEVLAGVGKLMSEQSFPDLALPLLRRANRLGMDAPSLHYLIGLAEMYAGDLGSAGNEFDHCLQADPDFAPAHRMRARLRRQTVADNHVDALAAAIARMPGDAADAPPLYYALFKELDDLDRRDEAWQALETGMRLRRRQVDFDADAEARLFDQLQRSGAAGITRTLGADDAGPSPIFIVGMPRSGTTLLERILGAHPQVADAGELRDFTMQLRWMCDRAGGPQLDLDLAQRAEAIDMAELGRRYLSHTRWHARGKPFYTDKLPANFVHAGYIVRALPQARILHMVREPMDTCFSNLKELFANAYPHSYDQAEMAGHFLRYRQLMAHWHRQYPGRILDVRYDALVAEPERVAREVLDFCGLAWDPSVVAIEARTGAVATASSVQMREPIHQRFIGQWRRYEDWLQPLRQTLEAGGLGRDAGS
ncbi:sulfotransferase family protein [Pseudoxanthomonas yeongjuensis]|uniref:tetratricopeptide repeat-containing sulfotransferase family protein n=1 Tax=Pseudoxanthomonas yeongjuensis TaxID=377616 RepID=UPI0013909662|nr:sulfotransferase [Pseudoxanthomonas yeongjuensis]KAF1717657.1 sulfotransferase family protein [Pseudoxanthomonas yeongjuensis]